MSTIETITCATPKTNRPAPKGKPETAVSLAALKDTPEGKKNRESWNAISAVRKAKTKKTDKLPIPPRKLAAQAASAADGLDIPDSLKVENRKPLTTEQQAKVDAAMAKAKASDASSKSDALRVAQAAERAEAKSKKAKIRSHKSKIEATRTTAMPLSGKEAARLLAAKLTKGKIARVVPPTARALKKNVKAVAAKKPADKKPAHNIGSVARAAILAGKTNEQALAAVMKEFPDCSSNMGCMSWYRNRMRRDGLIKGTTKTAAAKKHVAKKVMKPRPKKPARSK